MDKTQNTAWGDRDAMLTALRESGALRSCVELVEAVAVPSDIAVALATGRPELLKLARPRAMNETEVGQMYTLIGVLIRTNDALQAHAREIAAMTSTLHSQFRGAEASFKNAVDLARRVGAFAEFKQQPEDYTEAGG